MSSTTILFCVIEQLQCGTGKTNHATQLIFASQNQRWRLKMTANIKISLFNLAGLPWEQCRLTRKFQPVLLRTFLHFWGTESYQTLINFYSIQESNYSMLSKYSIRRRLRLKSNRSSKNMKYHTETVMIFICDMQKHATLKTKPSVHYT